MELSITKTTLPPFPILNQSQTTNEQPIEAMKRYELKYILTAEQCDYLTQMLVGKMEVDKYGLTSIASIYFDTPDQRLVRASIEKPRFKEKIRLRSYGLSKPGGTVFLELKRKANGLVYKRRISTTEDEANRFLNKECELASSSQIAKEITYFRDFYQNLVPAYLIIYDRVAYFEPGGDLRLTLDRNPRYRTSNLNLMTSMEGSPLLPEGSGILEIKVQQAMPLWLTDILSRGKIYQSSFSKVGEAYKKEMQKYLQERM